MHSAAGAPAIGSFTTFVIASAGDQPGSVGVECSRQPSRLATAPMRQNAVIGVCTEE